MRFCGVDCSAEALRQTERSLCRLVPGLPREQVHSGACMAGGSAGQLNGRASGASRERSLARAPPSNHGALETSHYHASILLVHPFSRLCFHQVELIEAEYLAGVEEARRRHPDALLSILWLGSSGGWLGSGGGRWG